MAEFDDLIEKTDKILNDLMDKQDKILVRSIKTLERRIIDMASELPKTKNGSLKFELKQAQEFQKNVLIEFENVYGASVARVVKDLKELDKLVIEQLADMNIDAAFTTADRQMFSALRKQTEKTYLHLGTKASDEISQALYDSVIGGVAFTEFVDQIRNALTGLEDVAGRPLATYAKTYAQDSTMGYYSNLHMRNAQEAGLDTFLYYGTVIATTRKWCGDHVHKVFTRNEIEDWRNFRWKGKAPGDPFIVRGGYNCRHHFLPVKREWVGDKITVK